MWTFPVARKLRLGDKDNRANNTPHHRKKYFSSSERDRIAQQGQLSAVTAQEHNRVRSRSRKPTPEPSHISSLPDNWKPNGSDRKVKQSMTSSLLRPRRRNNPQPSTELNQQQSTVSQDQAAWFLTLPDKVKRQHFSKEEQVLLAHRCELVLGSKAAKVKQESTQDYVRRRLNEFDFMSSSTSRVKTKQESAQDFCRRQLFLRPEGEASLVRRRRLSAPESTVFDDQSSEDSKSADAPEAVDDSEGDKMSSILNLYTRRHSVATTRENVTAPPVVAPAQIRSFRRSFALRPLPLPAPVLAPMPSPGFLKDKDQQPPAKQRRRPAPLVVTPPEMSTEAKHYKDPEMRRTLRTMSSPELFDEAIEFGFPPPPSEPASANLRSRFTMNTEIDRSSSLTSSSTTETRDLQFGRCPATPDGPADFLESPHGASVRFSPTCQNPSPTHPLHRRAHTTDLPNTSGPTYGHSRTPSSLNREMTLRLTLTRPILRSSETDPNPVRKTSHVEPLQRDPLALESIFVCDDPTGAQGAFAVPESSQQRKGIKHAFKNLVRK